MRSVQNTHVCNARQLAAWCVETGLTVVGALLSGVRRHTHWIVMFVAEAQARRQNVHVEQVADTAAGSAEHRAKTANVSAYTRNDAQGTWDCCGTHSRYAPSFTLEMRECIASLEPHCSNSPVYVDVTIRLALILESHCLKPRQVTHDTICICCNFFARRWGRVCGSKAPVRLAGGGGEGVVRRHIAGGSHGSQHLRLGGAPRHRLVVRLLQQHCQPLWCICGPRVSRIGVKIHP